MTNEIREAINKALALGSARFKDDIEASLNRQVRPAKMGRPRNRLGVRQEPK